MRSCLETISRLLGVARTRPMSRLILVFGTGSLLLGLPVVVRRTVYAILIVYNIELIPTLPNM